MLRSVYWHGQQTKTGEGFPGHVSCSGAGRINVCAVLTVVVGSVLAVLHLVCSSCAPPASHGDVCFGVGPNGTTHDAFCSGIHHVMLFLHITVGLRAMDFWACWRHGSDERR